MKFPIGIQDFECLRSESYAYIDKTGYIYKLAQSNKYYFLGRPRRFGKSLLLSTMEAYFSGKREIFKGLAIDGLEKKWETYPVLHLDLNTGDYSEPESLNQRLVNSLEKWEQLYGQTNANTSTALRFENVIARTFESTGRRVVILVDEYDKPLLQTTDNEELQDKHRRMLKAFYSVLKTQDKYIHFAFLTGVSKFSKVSIFRDLNNLNDISMDARYAGICGITEEEMRSYFKEPIQELAERNGMTANEACDKLKEQYDGYHFEHDTVGVYNPFSLLNTFDKMKFSDYWFETGTPSFLVKLMKRTNYRVENLADEEGTADMLNSVDSTMHSPVPIMYQSGYLTIKDYDNRFGLYKLGFPNKEVENGFMNYLQPYYVPGGDTNDRFSIAQFVVAVEKGDVDDFMTRLQALFTNGDYAVQGNMELYFQNTMYVIFKLMGFYVEVERRTARGRIDMVMKTANYVYVIEIKLDGTADDALRQIEDKGYAEPYKDDKRKVFKIGINFSSETRCIDDWEVS